MNSEAIDILERLENENDLVPSAIVQEAKTETSPLHEYLEWDDAKAARRYRTLQAARLMAHYQQSGWRDSNRVRVATDRE